MKDGIREQVSWTLDTPTKSNQLLEGGGDSAIKQNYEQLKDEDQVSEMGSFSTPLTQGEAAHEFPQCGEEVNHVHSHRYDGDDNIQQGESDPTIKSSPSKKRRKNNKRVYDNELQSKTKKKVFRPKIVLDGSWKKSKKPRKKSQPKTKISTPKPTSTPKKSTLKPSTPKKTTLKPSTSCRKSNSNSNDSRRAPLCKLSLLSSLGGLDEGKSSFSFLDNPTVDQQSDFESFICKNVLGSQYNSLQNYDKLTSLSSLCLIESKQVGANFPNMCKRRRIKRGRPRLEKFLAPFKKGTRSKSFTRKKKNWVIFTTKNMHVTRKAMKSQIMKIRSLKKKKKKGMKVKHNQIVLYKGSREDQLIPYKVEVALDKDTLSEWNLIMGGKNHEESHENKRKQWEEERNIYRSKVEQFISYMHVVQGNRKFSSWKGSVLDSVVGAYLTQNVSDHLSSSAYMSLAAKFPIKRTAFELCMEDPDTFKRHDLSDSRVILPKLTKDIEDFKFEEAIEVKKSEEIEGFSKVGNRVKKVKKMQMDEKETQKYWNSLRNNYINCVEEHIDNADSVDWEAVRCAEVDEIAEAIKNRGQHNVIAGRIKGLLNELKNSHGCLNLEWLRYVSPMQAKEYLLSIFGMGLKSVECIRLLTLKNQAFPVDVNVGRIAIRLGWVPLQPLPEEMQIHDLEKYPLFDNIQKYLWPRLCTLDPDTLYQLHYHLITFGKVFCTKKNPNCNACPMRYECRHFASASASASASVNDALPILAPTDEKAVTNNPSSTSVSNMVEQSLTTEQQTCGECEPIIEMPLSPEHEGTRSIQFEDSDEEVYDHDDSDEEVLTINLTNQESFSERQKYSTDKLKDDINISTSLVAFSNTGNIPTPKMKNASRLRTERLVYVLPDGHPLLAECIPRDDGDPYPYLLVIWTPGELANSNESMKNSLGHEEATLTVLGSLLVPCRTAMRGRFPLNGTYFQVNEVFADFDSMKNPIMVPRQWIWNLETRVVYFGTGTSSIMRGLSAKQIHDTFWKGFVCVRAIDMKTGAPRPLSYKFHLNTMVKVKKEKKNAPQREG